jgi:threonine synthase
MGLPVGKLICASNCNNVLTDFIRKGEYDRNREFYTTMSPSMDILVSSNLERLLYHLYDGSTDEVVRCTNGLKEQGRYKVSDTFAKKVNDVFYGGYCDEAGTSATIKEVFDKGYLCDTHTAVALKVYADYVAETGDNTKTVVASTANPFKFCSAVYKSVTGKAGAGETAETGGNEFDVLRELEKVSGVKAPVNLTAVENMPVRFTHCINKSDIVSDYIAQMK